MTNDSEKDRLDASLERVWDRFLTEQDKAHLAAVHDPPSVGFGSAPALLLVDNWRSALGETPLPLLAAVQRWPLSMGAGAWEAVDRIAELLELCRSLAIPIIHSTKTVGRNAPLDWFAATRQLPQDPSDPEIVRGVEIVEALKPNPGEVVIQKTGASAFFGSSLISVLHQFGIDTLLIAGQSTSGCVRATVVDAASHCFRTIVIEDCVYDRHEAAHAINLFDMSQKYADVISLPAATERLARDHNQ